MSGSKINIIFEPELKTKQNIMGVYKNIRITFSSEKFEISELADEIEKLGYQVESDNENIYFDGLGNWYEEENDLKTLSIKFVDTLIEVYHTEDEPTLDYYYNGKHESADVEIKFSPTTLTRKTFEELIEEMDSNGFAYFNYKNFIARNNEPCYIPESADCLEEVESYQTIIEQIVSAMKTEDFVRQMARNYDYKGVLPEEYPDDFNYLELYLKIWAHGIYYSLEGWAEVWAKQHLFNGDGAFLSIPTLIEVFTK